MPGRTPIYADNVARQAAYRERLRQKKAEEERLERIRRQEEEDQRRLQAQWDAAEREDLRDRVLQLLADNNDSLSEAHTEHASLVRQRELERIRMVVRSNSRW